MTTAQICRDGIRVRLIKDAERFYLQVQGEADPDDSREDMLPCDPDVLCAVLRGMTYQLVSAASYCVVRRTPANVTIEYKTDSKTQRCEMSSQEFGQLIAPMMPARLRAMLI